MASVRCGLEALVVLVLLRLVVVLIFYLPVVA